MKSSIILNLLLVVDKSNEGDKIANVQEANVGFVSLVEDWGGLNIIINQGLRTINVACQQEAA